MSYIGSTSFKTQEAFLTFYKQGSFAGSYVRTKDTDGLPSPDPVGRDLFCTNFSCTTDIKEHPAFQGFGAKTKNIHSTSIISSQVSVGAMLTQELDSSWIEPGHAPLVIFVDFIDDAMVSGVQAGDVVTAGFPLRQTIIIPNCICTAKNYSSGEAQNATVSLTFQGGAPIVCTPGAATGI